MFRKLTCAAALLLIAGCASNDNEAGVGTQQETASARAASTASFPSYGSQTAFPVGSIPTAVLHDAQRNKDVRMTVDYPTRGGPFPVVIFSHGFGGSKESYTPLTEYWTSRGYICIRPQHADAGALRDLMMKRREERRAQMEKDRAEGKTPQRRGRNGQQNANANQPGQPNQPDPMAEAIWATQTPADWANRARDISFIIDSLDTIERMYPELAGKMQKANIGVGGHSYGAFTTMLLAGTTSSSLTSPVADPRVKAGLAFSPQGAGQLGLTQESWRNVRLPIMFITGSLDAGLGGDAKWRHDPFQYSPAGDKYFLSFAGARHMTFTGGVGELTDDDIATPMPGAYNGQQTDAYGNPVMGNRPMTRGENQFLRDRRIFNNAKVVSAAFWDAYLKNDTAAKDYIKAGGTLDQSYSSGEVVAIERK